MLGCTESSSLEKRDTNANYFEALFDHPHESEYL